MDLASIYFGVFLAVFPFTVIKVVQQTRKILKRQQAFRNAYLYMIWVEAAVNLAFAIVTYLYLNKVIPGGLAFYIGTVTLWAIQTQLLSQIIANRVSLIMVNRRKAKWLKLGLVLAIGCVNIGVYIIWTSAYLPNATPEQKHLNDIFEKAEKSFFLVVDLGLNLLFLYLVRFRLIAGGLAKYWPLFNMNAALVCIATAMDAALLGMLSLPNPYLYVQFAPVVYIVKLNIELTMAAFIAKIVKGNSDVGSSYGHNTNRNVQRSNANGRSAYTKPDMAGKTSRHMSSFGNEFKIQRSVNDDEVHLTSFGGYGNGGIMRTVTTTVIAEADAESC